MSLKKMTARQSKLLSDHYYLIEAMYHTAIKKNKIPEYLEDELLQAMHDIAISAAVRHRKSKGPFDKYLSTSLYFAHLLAKRRHDRSNKLDMTPQGIDLDCFNAYYKDDMINEQACIDAIDELDSIAKKTLNKEEYMCMSLRWNGYTVVKIAARIKKSCPTIRKMIAESSELLEKECYATKE